MKTLQDAWEWYEATKEACAFLNALARRWDSLPWGEMSALPNRIGTMEKSRLIALSGSVQSPLDDLAVLVLFSVFEAILRAEVEDQLRPELEVLKHPALKKAGAELVKAVAEGSFYHGVLEPLKSPTTNDLVEQVNQVRRYRNWVAHGRREETRPEANVEPRTAYSRLQQFLDAIHTRDVQPSDQPA